VEKGFLAAIFHKNQCFFHKNKRWHFFWKKLFPKDYMEKNKTL
jgi:hypothetical protein